MQTIPKKPYTLFLQSPCRCACGDHETPAFEASSGHARCFGQFSMRDRFESSSGTGLSMWSRMGCEPPEMGMSTDATDAHSAIRAYCIRIVIRETPRHEYATIAIWSRAD